MNNQKTDAPNTLTFSMERDSFDLSVIKDFSSSISDLFPESEGWKNTYYCMDCLDHGQKMRVFMKFELLA